MINEKDEFILRPEYDEIKLYMGLTNVRPELKMWNIGLSKRTKRKGYLILPIGRLLFL